MNYKTILSLKNIKLFIFQIAIIINFLNLAEAKFDSDFSPKAILSEQSIATTFKIDNGNAILDAPKPKYLVLPFNNTGSNANLIINFTSQVPDGWEIGVYFNDSSLVGSAVVINNQGAPAIWGYDNQSQHGAPPGTVLKVKLLDTTNQTFENVVLLNIIEQISQKAYDTLKYVTNGVFIADGFLASSGVDDFVINTQTNLKAFPNPMIDHTTISFNLSKQEIVNLSIYDIFGREVVRLIDSKMIKEGNYSVPLNTALPAGLYFCRLEIGGISQVLKIIVVQ